MKCKSCGQRLIYGERVLCEECLEEWIEEQRRKDKIDKILESEGRSFLYGK